jgi:F-type H+-transporting ATPase subunit b
MSIDVWTIALQAINVLVLVWLLGRFFWRPLAAMIAARQVAAQQQLDTAAARRAEAEAALREAQAARAGLEVERAAMLQGVQAQQQAQRDALLDAARQQAQALLEAARAARDQEQEQARQAWRERAAQLALQMAQRLAARLDGAAVHEAFLGWLRAELAALPEATRVALARQGLRLTSARALDAAAQQRCREAIAAALGAPAQIAFEVDAALLGGLELQAAELRIANSWRADLQSLRAPLLEGGND